jgi:thiamine biosynthesis lipoprotein
MSVLRNLKRRDFLRLASLTGIGLAVPLFGQWLDRSQITDSRELETSMYALGTAVTIRVENVRSPIVAQAAVDSAFDEIKRLEGLFTRFLQGSEVGRLNTAGQIELAQPELVQILTWASQYSARTDGSFDITVKPALDLFEGRAARAFPPTEEEFNAAKSLIDFEKVSVSASTVSLARPGMGITLDCLGKGYILDKAAGILRSHRIESALIDGGGTLVAIGSRSDGSPWRIGIRDPIHLDRLIGAIQLEDRAVATSGDYENSFTSDRRYYHVIDPATAYSPLYSHSATVTAPTASEADPLALASMVKAPSQALSLIDQSPGCECIVIKRDGGYLQSSGIGMT